MTLKEEIVCGETHDLEFKRQANEDRSKFLKTAVAFANGKGGRILFGVNNDRTVCGVARNEIFTEMDAIVNAVSDGCVPRIPVDIGIENIDGKSVVVLEVLAGARCPYYLKSEGPEDGVYVRVGATTRQADDATRRELAYLSEGRSFDGEPCLKAKIDDKHIAALCSRMYRIARKNCTTEAKKRAVKRITPEQLESWGIISKVRDHWVASNAYALLTGDKAFPIRLKCGVFKGDTKAVFVDRREFTGSVMELIEEGFDYILAKINMGCVFKGVFRQDVYEIPPDELRELVVNAFAHRNYIEHDAPIFIAVYDTRVEITSPGGLPRGQTAERALAGYSKIRNTVLAKALNYMNFIEEWGSGLLRVNLAFRDSGLRDLEIEDAGFATRMNVYRNTVSKANGKTKQGLGSSPEVAQKVAQKIVGDDSNVRQKQPRNAFDVAQKRPEHSPETAQNHDLRRPLDELPASARNVLRLLSVDGTLTLRKLMERLHVAKATVTKATALLTKAGYLRHVGPNKGGHWEVAREHKGDSGAI